MSFESGKRYMYTGLDAASKFLVLSWSEEHPPAVTRLEVIFWDENKQVYLGPESIVYIPHGLQSNWVELN